MTFYKEIALAYDYIFPLNALQITFIEKAFPGNARLDLLDVGCATGNLSLALAQNNHKVTGIDLDETMIKLAQQKDTNNSVKFLVQNMVTIDKVFNPQSYDGIICFGNTLVHLPDLETMAVFLKAARFLLKPGGKLLLQLINYNRILDQSLDSLPTINNATIQFIRNYRLLPDKNRIAFETRLTVKENQQQFENTQLLYPLRKEELIELLNDSGFSECQFFGGFGHESWQIDAIPCVVQAACYS